MALLLPGFACLALVSLVSVCALHSRSKLAVAALQPTARQLSVGHRMKRTVAIAGTALLMNGNRNDNYIDY